MTDSKSSNTTQDSTIKAPHFLTVSDLNIIFNRGIIKGKNKELQAVKDVSFTLEKNEVLGVIGESGCGKSTLARSILKLQKPSSGTIKFKGQDLSSLNKLQQQQMRKDIQLIFQDPLIIFIQISRISFCQVFQIFKF